ncbi:MAG: amidohydrolase family protein [Acidobacteria bacterium]|nr:amidohydrolase family protein [Acidobacteriota bacterium]
MRVFRARWLLPIDGPPLDGGWVATRSGTVIEVGRGAAPGPADDLGDVALLPGLVNAHTHLELSGLAGRVRPADSMVAWIRAMLAERMAVPPASPANVAAMQAAVAEMQATGTVLVGDVSNSLASVPVLREAAFDAVVFHELIGFDAADPAAMVRDASSRAIAAEAEPPPDIRLSVVAHAPYSVAPALFTEIGRWPQTTPRSVHLAESAEEIEFLRSGTGPFRRLLRELGAWTPAWTPPGCDPVEYMKRVGYLSPGMLAVHGVHLTDDCLARLGEAEAVLVTCPRSNEWVGAGIPRLSHFYAAGVPVAIGTDSLASAPTLNLFDELAEIRRIAPDVSAASLLESATRIGAEALGFGRAYGTIAPGKRARFVAVAVPPGTADVEEYLVAGVPATAVRPVSG